MVSIIINQNHGIGNTILNMKKLNKNTQLTILIVTLFCIIIFLIITKINSTNNNQTSSTNSSSLSQNNNTQNDKLYSEETISNPNYIGETNSDGDKIYYESDSDEEFNGSEPLPSRVFITPTTSPNQDSEDQDSEDIGDISLDFPMERYLPYEGRYFRIEKYYDVNNLEVLVSDKSQTNLAKEEVKQWLIDQGDDQYDKFTIVYR